MGTRRMESGPGEPEEGRLPGSGHALQSTHRQVGLPARRFVGLHVADSPVGWLPGYLAAWPVCRIASWPALPVCRLVDLQACHFASWPACQSASGPDCLTTKCMEHPPPPHPVPRPPMKLESVESSPMLRLPVALTALAARAPGGVSTRIRPISVLRFWISEGLTQAES